MKLTKQKIILIFITLFFFFLPFFWFKPGEMDLGGDSSRLYFYDPVSYLKNYALYSISPSAFGAENIGYFMIPFVLLLVGLKSIFISPTILICVFHGISLSIAFLSCYGILYELLQNNKKKENKIVFLSAILSGFFYVLSQTAIQGWDKVLVTHNQFFLNPLMFFLFLKYFKTDKTLFLGLALIITFIFSPNFSFAAAPGFFAFYPISLIFLIIYRLFFLKKRIIWKHILVGLIAFILLQLFHIIPQLISMLSPGSVLNKTIFSEEGKIDRGLNYFLAIAPNIKTVINLMVLPQMTKASPFSYLFIIFPLITVFGFILNRTKLLLITGIFFLIVLFFATANITHIGFEVYKKLFNLPGFSIFRNFYGQWGYALLFFYTILFGQSLAIVLLYLRKRLRYSLIIFLILLLIVSAFPFMNGSLVNKEIWQSKNMHIFMKMDPNYEETISYVSHLPIDGKVLTFPLTDPGYQVLAGINNGAYQGPSTISYLAGKQDFAGLQEFGEFGDIFAQLVKNKQYKELNELLGFLNIKYIIYNADPRVYDTTFSAFPYIEVRKKLPATQAGYKELLRNLSLKQLKNINNRYYIFELEDTFYKPKLFASQDVFFFTKEINNWLLPLSFDEHKKQTFDLEMSQMPPVVSQTFTELDKKSVFTQIIKNPDPPRFLHYAFAKTPPSSYLYKPSVIKEYYDLQKEGDISFYIDKRMFLSAKLLYELEKWGHDMPILDRSSSSVDIAFNKMKKTDQERTLVWELQHSNNTWESILTRYLRNLIESIDCIKKNSIDYQWQEREKFLLNEYYLNHRERLDNVIEGSKLSEKEKNKLNKLLNKIYDFWLEKLQLSDLRNEKNEYIIPVIQSEKTTAALYINKEDFEKFDQTQFGLKIDGRELTISNDQDEEKWIKLNTIGIDFSKQNILEISSKSLKNILSTADLASLQISDTTDILTELKIKNGLVWKIKDWKPDNFYLLSFEYKNPDIPYAVRIYEETISDKNQQKVNQIQKDQIRANKWVRYQAVIKSGKDIKAAFLQIERSGTDNPLATMDIKNISLTYIPQPQFILKTVNKTNETKYLPNIYVTKINPTKYSVTVKNSKDPYYLLLNQSFNKRWKVFLEEDGKSKPLSENIHYLANGNMNSWYIDSKIVNNKNDYKLTIEMVTQKYFYISAIISLITLVTIVIFILYRLLKLEK